jgi:hypothetical protein
LPVLTIPKKALQVVRNKGQYQLKRHIFSPLAVCLFLPVAAHAQSTTEARFAKAVLQQIQNVSFRNNREYCGYIGYNEHGILFASNARRGHRNGCVGKAPDNMDIVASFHTHGAFDVRVPAEFPSATDLKGDRAEGISGYIATPGGRFWYSDSVNMVVSQICGVGCLKQDPGFVPGLDGNIRHSYTLNELIAIEGR